MDGRNFICQDDQNSNANLNKCGGFRQRDNRAEATADFQSFKRF